MNENQTIGDLVRKLEKEDMFGITHISKYVDFNQRDNTEKIDAYINSKHISGEVDSKGRDKPFFNVVIAARNITYRATDVDRKNLKILPGKGSDRILAFLAKIKLQEWMRKNAFGKFLNEWGLSLATYGSSILKFVEQDGELHSQVMSWADMIVDPVDFNANPKIEKIWLTPSQLLKRKGYDQDLVMKLIDSQEVRETSDGQEKDNKEGYIPIYEIHGELPLSYKTGMREDENTYEQWMYVVSFVESKENNDEFDDYVLYSGREKKDPYMITHLIETKGRTQSIGAVENLFQSQWMQNHTAKMIKDNLDITSKIIFQTSDGTFTGKNALKSIENGDILIHTPNQPLTQINNRSDITASQSFQQMWKQLGNEINGLSDAMLGVAPKSGTAWRQTEALLQESHSLFELMTENKSIDMKYMLTTYIIPFFKKSLDTAEEIMPILEDYDIKFIDQKFIPNEAIRQSNAKLKAAVLSGKAFSQEQQDEDIQVATDSITNAMQSFGDSRPLRPSEISSKTWKSIFKNLEWDLEYDISGEARDTQLAADNLIKVLQYMSAKQGQPMSPEEKLVFNKILSVTNSVDPLELSQIEGQSQPAMPQGGQESVAVNPAEALQK